jgi:hypothetical protein
LITLKNVSQTILGFQSSGVWFQDGGQQVSENCGIYTLKEGRVKGDLMFILGTRDICRWFLVHTGNNMYNMMRAGMDAEELDPAVILIFLHLKNNRNVFFDVRNSESEMKLHL